MDRFIWTYMLICSMVNNNGYEATLLDICKNIILYNRRKPCKKRILSIDCIRYAFYLKRIKCLIEEGRLTGNCMAISLFFFWLLEYDGYDPHLINGVLSLDEKVEAHMWIECGKTIINGMKSKGFVKIREVTLQDVINGWIENSI